MKNQLETHNINGLHTIHFLEIEDTDHESDGINAVSAAYLRAQAKAKPFGGVKVHNRRYGGGIGFNDMNALLACVAKYGDTDQ